MPHQHNEALVRLSKEDANITTSNNGGGNVEYEEVLDLQPPTDVEYLLRDTHPGLQVLLELEDSGTTAIADSAQLRWVGQKPLEEDTTALTRVYRYGEFAQSDQYDDDSKVYFEFVVDDFPITFTEGSHLKLQMLHDTAVDWSNSKVEFEIYRRSYG